MVYYETNFSKDLRDTFCNAVNKVFGDSEAFLDFIENRDYSTSKYDCYTDYNGENYIINRETGEYINWYKFNHIGRDIHILIIHLYGTTTEWIEKFLFDFKESK